jgi:hypothetical protein
VAKAKLVKPKKRCCTSRPRCKRCPVVMKRLHKHGLAERQGGGVYLVTAGAGQLKAARKGKHS